MSLPTPPGSQSLAVAPTDPFADLINMARLVVGDQDGAASIDQITIRIGARSVLAVRDGDRWHFRVVALPGRRPGPSAVRVARDYQAILGDVQRLRASQLRSGAASALRDSRWLRTLALSWPDATLTTVPAWLRDVWLRVDPGISDSDPGLLVPLSFLTNDEVGRQVKSAAWAVRVVFEGEPLECEGSPLGWNDFAVGNYRPSDFARRLVAIRHAPVREDGRRVPLSDEHVRRLIRKGRVRGA